MTTTAGDPVLELEYPKAFANAFAPTLTKHGKRFRYMHITGAMVERDPNKTLWMKSTVRKTKVCDLQRNCDNLRTPADFCFIGWLKVLRIAQGQGEIQMIDFADSSATNGLWETIIARSGLVVKRGSYAGEVSMMLAGSSGSVIRSDELALALIDAVQNESDNLLLPPKLLQRGQQLMKAQSEK
jgi:hypothetical protein